MGEAIGAEEAMNKSNLPFFFNAAAHGRFFRLTDGSDLRLIRGAFVGCLDVREAFDCLRVYRDGSYAEQRLKVSEIEALLDVSGLTFDLKPIIDDAKERVNIAVDEHIAAKLVALGWTPPKT